MKNISPEERLREAVMDLNNQARWNRIEVALERVSPKYQAYYRSTHSEWGEEIQIADNEVVGMIASRDEEDAISRVTFRWYRQDSMIISDTVVKQTWKKSGRTFMLIDEVIENGHPGLLAFVDTAPTTMDEFAN